MPAISHPLRGCAQRTSAGIIRIPAEVHDCNPYLLFCILAGFRQPSVDLEIGHDRIFKLGSRIYAVNPEGNDSYDGGRLSVTISDKPQTDPEPEPERTNNTVLKDAFGDKIKMKNL